MNIKVTYKYSNEDKVNEDRLYKLMCNIIKKDIQKNIKEGNVYEEKCMSTESFHRYARNISSENSNR